MSGVKVIKAADHDSMQWHEVARPEDDDTPPGEDIVAFEDGGFSVGLWRRPPREGVMTRPFDEVSIVIDGIAEVVDPDGTVHRGEPGGVLVTPRGSGGMWRCVTAVEKFWMIVETEIEAPGTIAIPADAALDWAEVPRPEGDEAPPGEEVVLFRTASGDASCGFWRRGPEEGKMDLPDYHEIAYILEGNITVTEDDGTAHEVGPGDILVTPRGTRAWWHSHSPVRKFWTISKG